MLQLAFCAVVILALLVVSYRGHSQWAGVLAGFPTVTALFTLWGGTYSGVGFVYEATFGIQAGLLATTLFVAAYAAVARFGALASTLAAFLAYAAVTMWLSMVRERAQDRDFWATAAIAIAMMVAAVAMTEASLRSAKRARHPSRHHLSRVAAPLLSSIAVSLLGGQLGAWYAGLAAPFPVTIFPVLIMAHLQHGTVLGTAAAVVRGLLSTLVFTLTLRRVVEVGWPLAWWYAMAAAAATLGAVYWLYLHWPRLPLLRARGSTVSGSKQRMPT